MRSSSGVIAAACLRFHLRTVRSMYRCVWRLLYPAASASARTYRSAPQSDIFVNTPLLTGFVQTEDMRGNALPQPFHPEFEPIHMTGVQAVKILRGRQANEDLYRICLLWSGWIPVDGDRGQPRA